MNVSPLHQKSWKKNIEKTVFDQENKNKNQKSSARLKFSEICASRIFVVGIFLRLRRAAKFSSQSADQVSRLKIFNLCLQMW